MKLVQKMKKVGFPRISLAEVDFQIGAEKMHKMRGYSDARNRNRWVRDMGMWIMRRRSLDVTNNCARSGCEEFPKG